MRSILRNGMALLVATLFSVVAFAHVTEIRVKQNQDGSLTWYLQSYHGVSECGIQNSGLKINGVPYPLQAAYSGSLPFSGTTLFAQHYGISWGRASYAVVTTPYVPGNLNVQPYSNNVCWAFLVGGNGSFTPPPPPTCTSCPVTGVSANFDAGSDNGTSCNVTDDYVTANMVVNHLACASITGDGKFSVSYNGTMYGPYNYSTGITTSIPLTLSVAQGQSSTPQITVMDADFGSNGCSYTGGASYGSVFAGVSTPDVTAPVISCPFNIVVNADANGCGAYVNYSDPSATDNCGTGALPTSIPGYTYKGTLNGHTYFLSNSMATPEAAHAAAISLGGHLATIANATENNFVSGFTTGRMWIGMTDRDSEGTWGWITNEPYNYSNWAPGEPNNYLGNEDWAVINWSGSNPDWNDWFYTQPAFYTVEFDGGAVPTTRTGGQASGSFFAVGTHTITYQAVDQSGNVATCSFNITVNDNVAPVVSTQDITVVLDANSQASVSSSDIDAGSSDNCSIASMSISNGSFDCSNLGANTVYLTVTDANGNSSVGSAVVTVVDNAAPVVVTQNASVTLVNGTASVTVADIDNGSSDNCGIASMSLDNDTWSCGDIGTQTVTLTVTDVNGNVSTGTASVTVNGVIPSCSIVSEPTSNVYTGGDPNKIYLGYGAQSTKLNMTPYGGNSFTYSWTGSGLSSTSVQDPIFTPTSAGSYTFTCTVTNDNGCETTCSITICVEDVRVYKSNGQIQNGKVYLCHSPNGNPNNSQTLSISVNAVGAHLSNHANDALGTCGQTACGSAKGYVDNAGDMYVDETAAGDMELVVYPNPSRSQFGLMLESPVEGMIQIRVYTLQGQIVEQYKSESNIINMEFGSNLATGIYMLDVVQGDYRKTVRIEKL